MRQFEYGAEKHCLNLPGIQNVLTSYYASKPNPPKLRGKTTLIGAEEFERPRILQIDVSGLKCELKDDQSHAVRDI